MKSKTKLFWWLSSQKRFKTYGKRVDFSTPGISNEIYGKKACIYIFGIQQNIGISREQLILELRCEGFKVSRTYGEGNLDAVEIQVSYFKGWHWDE